MNTNTHVDIDHIEAAVRHALQEDIGSGDVTAQLCESKTISAKLVSRETAILCGQDWFNATFDLLDESIQVEWKFTDGEPIYSNDLVCTISGDARNILTGERTALNFLQTLSGTATTTNQYAQKLAGTKTKLLDTRKTIPGMRYAQKYAVRCGGGLNHRMGLFDAYLIKENHITTSGSISNAITKAKSLHPELTVEVEVETLDQLQEAIYNKADIALLDNFSLEEIASAITLSNNKIKLEVSGGVTLENLQDYALLGVDYISVGALTKHVHAIDFSILFE